MTENPVERLNRLRKERAEVMRQYREHEITATAAVKERQRLDEAIRREQRRTR